MPIGQNSFLIEIARKRETKCNYCEDRQVERGRQTERERQIERERKILCLASHTCPVISNHSREKKRRTGRQVERDRQTEIER